jgi:mannose-1-phosphate guanylyltransferase
MKIVMLSGGSGKRLWPLSNDSRSKQFLEVLPSTNGERQSMVQRVWGQLNRNNLVKDTVIATSKKQTEMLRKQLGYEVNIVEEPERRDTFPAIALAASYLFTELNCALDEVVSILPVDPFVEDKFFEKLFVLEDIIQSSNSDLALIGVKPVIPSEKYGYILPETSTAGDNLSVKQFIEKPAESYAKELIEDGALWNCGVFAFELRYIIEMLSDKGLPTDYTTLCENYNLLEKNSFDYEVVEKAKNITVTKYDGFWKDLGTWNTLTEQVESNVIGKGVLDKNLTNSYIINELNIPIVMLGTESTIVSASYDGILVTSKESSPAVKEYLDDIITEPMFEDKVWGSYRTLEHTTTSESDGVITRRITVNSNIQSNLVVNNALTTWTVIQGEGYLEIETEVSRIYPGASIQFIPSKTYSLKSINKLEIIEVSIGSKSNGLGVTFDLSFRSKLFNS